MTHAGRFNFFDCVSTILTEIVLPKMQFIALGFYLDYHKQPCGVKFHSQITSATRTLNDYTQAFIFNTLLDSYPKMTSRIFRDTITISKTNVISLFLPWFFLTQLQKRDVIYLRPFKRSYAP